MGSQVSPSTGESRGSATGMLWVQRGCSGSLWCMHGSPGESPYVQRWSLGVLEVGRCFRDVEPPGNSRCWGIWRWDAVGCGAAGTSLTSTHQGDQGGCCWLKKLNGGDLGWVFFSSHFSTDVQAHGGFGPGAPHQAGWWRGGQAAGEGVNGNVCDIPVVSILHRESSCNCLSRTSRLHHGSFPISRHSTSSSKLSPRAELVGRVPQVEARGWGRGVIASSSPPNPGPLSGKGGR